MTPARARRAVDIFTGMVIVSVGLALANLTWRLGGYPGVGPAAAPVVPGNGSSTDISPLIALAPFGKAIANVGDGGDGAVRLRAIFMAVPAEASTVLIAGADGKVTSYGIGEAVGGGVIEAIHADQVVLRTSGGQRAIGFNPDAVTAAAAGSATSPRAVAAAASFVPASPPPIGGVAAVRSMIPPSVQGAPPPGTAAAQSPPPSSSGAAPVSPGYRVGTAPNPALLDAGLRPGDVVMKVNGVAVNAGTNERDLMAAAMASGNAQVEFLRDGQRVSLTVPVR